MRVVDTTNKQMTMEQKMAEMGGKAVEEKEGEAMANI